MDMKMRADKIIESIKNITGFSSPDIQFAINIIIIILLNIAAITLNFRIDLTRNSTYSLSGKSREIVSGLNENLKIRVFFSKDLPAEYAALSRYVQDLLNEYEYHGNRHFSWEMVDDKDLKKQAEDFGIRPVVVRELADDQVRTRQTYMGLVIQQADLMEKIESITDPVGLEYKITTKIEKISGKIDGLLKLKSPILLKLYLDSRIKDLPIDGITTIEQRAREAVDKANINNYGKIAFSLVDSSSDPRAAAQAEKYGLARLKWPPARSKSGKLVEGGEGMLGLVLEKGDRFQRFDVNIGQSLFGNYVITGMENLIDRINNGVSSIISSNRKIGYITGHGSVEIENEQSRDGGALFKRLLSDIYEVVPVDIEKEPIPSDIDTIIVNGPREKFGDDEIFAIDQFLMAGKSMVLFLDSFNEIELPQQQAMFGGGQPIIIPVHTGIDEMLKHYGITVNRDIVLDTSCAKIDMDNMIKDYPVLPVITRKGLNSENIITRYLQSLLLVKASSVTSDENRLKEQNIKKTTLLSSSDESWVMTGKINFNPFLINPPADKDRKKYELASLFSGKFSSYFTGKEAPVSKEDPKVKKGTDAIKSIRKLDRTIESGNTSIIVIGTSEITRSGILMYARKILSTGSRGEVYSNEHFLHSLVDYLAGNHNIPEMNSKSLDYSPLERKSDRFKFIAKVINFAGVPLAVAILGFAVWRERLKRKRIIMNTYAREEKK